MLDWPGKSRKNGRQNTEIRGFFLTFNKVLTCICREISVINSREAEILTKFHRILELFCWLFSAKKSNKSLLNLFVTEAILAAS
jgi:hypothetical protein